MTIATNRDHIFQSQTVDFSTKRGLNKAKHKTKKKERERKRKEERKKQFNFSEVIEKE